MYSSPYIRFLSSRQERDWFENALHPALYVIVLIAARWHYLRTKKPAVITSLIRPDDPGVHGDGRGADLRTWELDQQGQKEWEDYLNFNFPYVFSSKKEARTAKVHEVKGEDGVSKGLHLHLQVGPLEPKPKPPESFII